MTMTAETLRRRCADEMSRNPRGFADATWLHEAFLSVPREHFVPDQVWWPALREDGLYSLIDRTERPKAWLKSIYQPGTALITQIDDGQVQPTGPAHGSFSSSISSSGVVVELLRHLDPEPTDRILEIGTGTGYTTALLAFRAGAENVVTIEIDPQLAARARTRLAELSIQPLVITGDGELGHTAGGPYDRIVATASVRHIPPAWIHQLKPGGILLAPLDSPLGCDLLLRLEADGNGGAAGDFVAQVEFMRLRGQRRRRSYADLGWPTELDPERWQELRVDAGPAGQEISHPSSRAA